MSLGMPVILYAYQFSGTPQPPSSEFIVTESGDEMIGESGDRLITE